MMTQGSTFVQANKCDLFFLWDFRKNHAPQCVSVRFVCFFWENNRKRVTCFTNNFVSVYAEPRGHKGKLKIKKKFKRFLLPLLLAYKLKFFTLIPVLIGGLILLTGATGLAGFFFALFAAVMGLKSGHHH